MSDPVRNIDTEIALVATLGALVIAYPTDANGFYPIIKFIAGSLFVLTLIRRLLIIDRVEGSRLLFFTEVVMYPATYISIIYLIYYSITEFMPAYVLELSLPITLSALLLGLVAIGFGIWIMISDRFFEELSDNMKGKIEDIPKGLLFDHFRSFFNYHLDVYNPEDVIDKIESDRDSIPYSNFKMTLLLVGIVVFAFSPTILTVQYLFGGNLIEQYCLIAVIYVTHGVVLQWYKAYGLREHPEFIAFGTIPTVILEYVMVSVVFVMYWIILS